MSDTALFANIRCKNKHDLDVVIKPGDIWQGLISIEDTPAELLVGACDGELLRISTDIQAVLELCGSSTKGKKFRVELEDPETHEIDEKELKPSSENFTAIMENPPKPLGEEPDEEPESHHAKRQDASSEDNEDVDEDEDDDEEEAGQKMVAIAMATSSMIKGAIQIALAGDLTSEEIDTCWTAAGGVVGDASDMGSQMDSDGMPPGFPPGPGGQECKQQ